MKGDLPTEGVTAPKAFENTALNYLAGHRDELRVATVWRYENARIDGMVELVDGRRLAVEIKYWMNWPKACQACTQISWFAARRHLVGNPIAGGLVIFEGFSGDWARQHKSWQAVNGWSYFYTDHQHTESGLRIDLLRLHDGQLQSFVDVRQTALD